MRRVINKCICLIVAVASVCAFAYACTGEGSGSTNTDIGNTSPTFSNGIDVGDNYATEYNTLMNGTQILKIEMTVNDANYQEMLANPENEEYFSASFTINSDSLTNVGLRTSGNTDLSEFSDASADRYNFKVKFDKFVDKQKFLKLDEMNLINLNRDPSYMREALSYMAFASLNAAAPLASFAQIYINGTFHGLYLAVESIDDAFLKRNYGDNDGNLYKASEGATLLDDTSLQYLDQKNGADKSKSDLTSFISTLNAMPTGSKGDIESVLDVDSVLKYIAVCAGIGSYTSYLGKNAENYYLIDNDGKFSIIPWDFKGAFGNTNGDNGTTITLTPYEPVFRTTMEERPLVSKLLAVEEYCKRYEEYLTNVREFLENIQDRINTIDTLISDGVKNDTTALYGEAQYLVAIGKSDATGNTTGVISLLEYAQLRAEHLKSLNF